MGKSKGKGKREVKAPEEPKIVGIYEVEAIVAAKPIPVRSSEQVRYKYFVQWYGYPGENTWEPIENLRPDCDRLVQSFWAEVGSKYRKGSTAKLEPSQEWIDSEVEYFRRTYKAPDVGPHNQRVIVYNEETGRVTAYD